MTPLRFTIPATALLVCSLASGCLDAGSDSEQDPATEVATSELRTDSFSQIRLRADPSLCWQNVAATLRLRPCVAGLRTQEFIASEPVRVNGILTTRIRARSGNCVASGPNGGDAVILRECASATRWGDSNFSIDFPSPSGLVLNRVPDDFPISDLFIQVDAITADTPLRVRRTTTNERLFFL